MNYYKAVFWDYPRFNNAKAIRRFINENYNNNIFLWMMYRFLEFGRVVDTLEFFTIEDISNNLPKIKLSDYSRNKWNRMIEVYGIK